MLMKRRKLLFLSWSLAIVISLLFWGGGIGYAKVTGECSHCHTMHNSQDGTTFPNNTEDPNDFLLIGGCVGCHTGTNIPSSTSIPYVLDTVRPYIDTNTLAGGNFWWVTQDEEDGGGDAKGHNVLGIATQDLNISVTEGAPGNAFPCANSCHLTLAAEQTAMSGFGSGCQGCHLRVMHHYDDGTGTKYVGASPWYRFLSGHATGDGNGVVGIEDEDWQLTENTGDHNEYLGSTSADKNIPTGFILLGNTMTAFCCGCHGYFHAQDATAEGESPWLRHPSDFVIPDEGEYASMSELYNPDIPIARSASTMATLDGTPGQGIEPGTDMVMCLSCHYAHGSPYDDMLRWDYSTMEAGGGSNTNGCFFCHTTKDD